WGLRDGQVVELNLTPRVDVGGNRIAIERRGARMPLARRRHSPFRRADTTIARFTNERARVRFARITIPFTRAANRTTLRRGGGGPGTAPKSSRGALHGLVDQSSDGLDVSSAGRLDEGLHAADAARRHVLLPDRHGGARRAPLAVHARAAGVR